MARIIGIYGVLSGIIVAVGMVAGITLIPHGGTAGMVVGYLNMLVALSMVFVGIKQYRDTLLGGVIRFPTALGVGLGIAVIASLFYVLTWELYMFMTNYRFMDEYVAKSIADMQAKGTSAYDLAKFAASMTAFKVQYANPLSRMLMTFSEIAPVGLLVSVISAALLRNHRLFPRRAGQV
jgi:Protein of unknown function (DUF4199)